MPVVLLSERAKHHGRQEPRTWTCSEGCCQRISESNRVGVRPPRVPRLRPPPGRNPPSRRRAPGIADNGPLYPHDPRLGRLRPPDAQARAHSWLINNVRSERSAAGTPQSTIGRSMLDTIKNPLSGLVNPRRASLPKRTVLGARIVMRQPVNRRAVRKPPVSGSMNYLLIALPPRCGRVR